MSSKLKFKIPKFIAHRGASNHAPENTIAAIQEAKIFGAHCVEVDVKLTACGMLILFHDESLERTTNGKGLVKEWSYKDLKTLDAGSWFSPEFQNERIPTFKKFVDCCKSLNMLANIEIKPCKGREMETVNAFIDAYQRLWPSELTPPIISCQSPQILLEIQRKLPSLLRALIVDKENYLADWFDWHKQLGCYALHCDKALLPNQAIFDDFQNKADNLLIFTINDPLEAQKFIEWGVTSIFTDYYDILSWSCYWDEKKELSVCL